MFDDFISSVTSIIWVLDLPDWSSSFISSFHLFVCISAKFYEVISAPSCRFPRGLLFWLPRSQFPVAVLPLPSESALLAQTAWALMLRCGLLLISLGYWMTFLRICPLESTPVVCFCLFCPLRSVREIFPTPDLAPGLECHLGSLYRWNH